MMAKIDSLKKETHTNIKNSYSNKKMIGKGTQNLFRVGSPRSIIEIEGKKQSKYELLANMKLANQNSMNKTFQMRSKSHAVITNPEAFLMADKPWGASNVLFAENQNLANNRFGSTILDLTNPHIVQSYREKRNENSSKLEMEDSRSRPRKEKSPQNLVEDPPSPLIFKPTKLKPIVLDSVKFRPEGGIEIISSREQEKNRSMNQMIESNGDLIRREKDEMVGKNLQKIKMTNFSLQSRHPLFKFDEETAIQEFLNKEEFGHEEKKGFCRYYDLKSEKYTWEECRIIGKYADGRYVIYWLKNNERKIVDRLNLRYAEEMGEEEEEEYQKKFDAAVRKRHIEVYNLSLKSKKE